MIRFCFCIYHFSYVAYFEGWYNPDTGVDIFSVLLDLSFDYMILISRSFQRSSYRWCIYIHIHVYINIKMSLKIQVAYHTEIPLANLFRWKRSDVRQIVFSMKRNVEDLQCRCLTNHFASGWLETIVDSDCFDIILLKLWDIGIDLFLSDTTW